MGLYESADLQVIKSLWKAEHCDGCHPTKCSRAYLKGLHLQALPDFKGRCSGMF